MRKSVRQLFYLRYGVLLVAVFETLISKAQDFPFDQVTPGEISMNSHAKFPGAADLVLREFGKTGRDIFDNTRVIHSYHARIKVFKAAVSEAGNIKIYCYRWDDGTVEEVKDFQAVIYYKDPLGKEQRQEANQTEGFFTDESKHYRAFKLALPHVVDNCVIEYRYKLSTPDLEDYKPWFFQTASPKLHSEYELHVPEGHFNYRVRLAGLQRLTINSIKHPPGCYEHTDERLNCAILRYGMDTIPAFKPEEHMTNPINFVSTLYFDKMMLAWDYKKDNMADVKWAAFEKELMSSDFFGGQMEKEKIVRKALPQDIDTIKDELQKTKFIYHYINKTIKLNNDLPDNQRTGIRATLKNREANTTDINLLLITALRSCGIKADPVLLSTKENGYINKAYPTPWALNYMVALAEINKRAYLLDATDPLLPFGLIPARCLNDQGRVVSRKDSSYWIELRAPMKSTISYVGKFKLQPDGKISGTVDVVSSGYTAFDRRKKIKSINGNVNDIAAELEDNFKQLKVLKTDISNLDSADALLTEHYEVEVKSRLNIAGNIGFNPYLLDKLDDNPFKLTERKYPIDLGPPSDSRVIVTLELPDGYHIDTEPQPLSLALPEDGGRFNTTYQKMGDNTYIFSHALQFNRSVYLADDYFNIKALYNKIIQAEKTELTFQKNE